MIDHLAALYIALYGLLWGTSPSESDDESCNTSYKIENIQKRVYFGFFHCDGLSE
jgi:hypothetical protein